MLNVKRRGIKLVGIRLTDEENLATSRTAEQEKTSQTAICKALFQNGYKNYYGKKNKRGGRASSK